VKEYLSHVDDPQDLILEVAREYFNSCATPQDKALVQAEKWFFPFPYLHLVNHVSLVWL